MISTTTTVTGLTALACKRLDSSIVLCKRTDPIEDAREGLTLAEAEAVAREDASLVHAEVPYVVFSETTWRKDRTTHEAVVVAWRDLDKCLGRKHEGGSADDNRIVASLLASGAPAWVADAEGDTDESGWALLGPIVEADA